MDAKKRRSVLRKSTAADFVSTDATPRLKRRISFSGKHLVREFQSEEEPKTWNNSYEISDHLNVDESASNICVSNNKSLLSALKKPHEGKENVVQLVSHNDSQNHRNVSVTNTTRDLINVSYKKYNIENSVDITLIERELKYRVGNADDHTATYMNSFSLDENEKQLSHTHLVDRTVDFMRNDTNKNTLNNDLTQHETLNMRAASMMVDCTKNDNIGGFTVYSEFTDGIQNMEVTCVENERTKELYTIYMNDSMSPSYIEQSPTTGGTKKTTEKRKTIQRPVPMEECSPLNAKLCNKENIIPISLNSNTTINKSCYMEIDDNCLGPKTKVNVDSELQEFHGKLDQLSFLSKSDNNMQMDVTQTAEVCRRGAIPKVKSRPTINFNQPIEVSPVKDKSNGTNGQTVRYNVDIRDASQVKLKTKSTRQTVNFLNEDIQEDSPVKAKSNSMRQTVNCNTDMSSVSPAIVKSNPLRQTVNFNEDIQVSPVKSSQESTTKNGHRSNKPVTSLRKNCQTLVVRKICTPLINKSKTKVELEQQRMLRFKKKLEQVALTDNVKHDAADKATTAIKPLNISTRSSKRLSLSPDMSSPLIPSEFKVYNFKQLNDELERGNLHVYSNAPKTPLADRKTKRRTLVFQNADIPIAAADDTLTNAFKSIKSNDFFDCYSTQEPAFDRQKKKNAKFRYSQADDNMLDNTSFLTQAKLGDETASRNSSKRDASQVNNIDVLSDEPLLEAGPQLVGEKCVKSLKENQANITLSSAEPIIRLPITNSTTYNNSECTTQYNNETNFYSENHRKSSFSTHSSECHTNVKKRHTIHLNDDIDLCDILPRHNDQKKLQNDKTEMDLKNRTSVCYANNMDIEDECTRENINLKTVYVNHDMEIDNEEVDRDQSKLLNGNELFRAKTNDITDIENSEKIIQQMKQHHKRHTLHFDNENIENEEPYHGDMETTAVATLKSSRHTKHYNIDNDIDAETLNSPKGKIARQHTLYLDGDIEDDQSYNLNGENKQLEKGISKNNPLNKQREESSNQQKQRHLRHTMHFDNENIDCEIANGEQNNIDVTDADAPLANKDVFTTVCAGNVDKMKKPRQTMLFHQDIDLESSNLVSTEVCANDSISTSYSKNNATAYEKLSQPRKSIYAAQCMDLTLENLQTKENYANDKKVIRRTLHFHGELLCDEEVIQKESPVIRSSVQNNENELSLDENTKQEEETKSSREKRNTLHFDQNNDISMDLSIRASAEKSNIFECQASTQNSPSLLRRNQYYDQNEVNIENDLSLDENALPCEHRKQKIQSSHPQKNKTLHFINNDDNDISTEQYDTNMKSKLPIAKEPKSSTDKRKTLHFEANNDISIDESLLYSDTESTERPLNAAKMSLLRHSSANIKNSLAQKMKSFIEMTPVLKGSASSSRLNEMTPGMLEFIAEEKKSQVGWNLERAKFTSPLRSELSMKRLPVNLTPIVAMAKKRQTLLFDDCNMNVTHTPRTMATNNRTHVVDQVMDISGIVSNESVMSTTPSPAKQRISRIPIPLSSKRKSTKSPSLSKICPSNEPIGYKELVVQIDDGIDEQVAVEEEQESLQILRRATTFTQKTDLTMEPKIHDSVLDVKQPFGQPSLFEDNPITISDVSVFFTAQRKSNNENTTVPLPELPAAMTTTNISDPITIERNNAKSFHNPYINLTCDSPLEDIDQTRLSLVRTLSDDEDDDDNDGYDKVNEIVVEYNEAFHGQNPPVTETAATTTTTTTETGPCSDNCADSRLKFRNVSAVCRKCKRCQDTFLNETTFSTEDSFVLPALPPFPDLGLDRLRRLRTRPTISDVNVLWQRVSLDRTIINPINITDDDTQIVSNAEEYNFDEDKLNPALIALRKYHKERQDFELELLESLQEKTPALLRQRSFVHRLEDILSNNSNNWMFDYQKQVRGIYLFSHRKMLTFSVALTFEEVDPFGIDVNLTTVNLQQSHVPKKNWKAIDFILDFQLKLNLPYDLQSLCKSSNEADIFKMLQEIDRICVQTVKMGQALQRVVFGNQASIIRDESRTYVRKIIRKTVKGTDKTAQHVQKIEIKIEILNLKKLSFKDIAAPPLHHFREEIHLLPVGLQFLNVFLENPLNYLKCTTISTS